MAKSLFVVFKQGPSISKNILSEDGAKTALQAAIEAAGALEGTLQSVNQLEGAPIDYTLPPAVAPVTDGADKAVYRIQFQSGTGPNNTNLNPVRVEAWSQASGGVTTHAADLAVAVAIANAPAGAVPNAITLVGTVDIDTTV